MALHDEPYRGLVSPTRHAKHEQQLDNLIAKWRAKTGRERPANLFEWREALGYNEGIRESGPTIGRLNGATLEALFTPGNTPEDPFYRHIARQIARTTTRIFPAGMPEDPDLRDLCLLLQSERGKSKSDAQIAREFTRESKDKWPRARRLLSRIRKMRQQGRVNL